MSYKAGNQLAKVNTKTPVFDADEIITNLPLANSTMSLTYDSRNRLTNAAGVTSAYDAENHRVSTTNAQGKTNYVINPESPLSQVLIMYRPGPQKTSYIYGKGLVSQVKDGQTLYYHYDMRGSTVAITNQNGDIVDRFSYLPFGGVIQHTLGNTKTPYLYNGRDGVMNDGNGLYYMRARFYSPEIRRFVNRDVLLGDVMVSNALNRFSYVNGNPVSLVDPLGLYSLQDFGNHVLGSYEVLESGFKFIAGTALLGGADLLGADQKYGRQLVKSGLQDMGDGLGRIAKSMGREESGKVVSSIISDFGNSMYQGEVDKAGIVLAYDIFQLGRNTREIVKGDIPHIDKYIKAVKNERRVAKFSLQNHRTSKARAAYTKLHIQKRKSRKKLQQNLMNGSVSSIFEYSVGMSSYINNWICDE